MAQIGVAILTIHSSPPEIHTLVLDGIKTADRPAAIGYFILEAMRVQFSKNKGFPQATIQLGGVDTTELDQRMRQGFNIYSTKLHAEDFGEIYKLVLAVERGDEGILNT